MTHGENIRTARQTIREYADLILPGRVCVGYCGLSKGFPVFLKDKRGVWGLCTVIDLHHPQEDLTAYCLSIFTEIRKKMKEEWYLDWDAELKRLMDEQ